MRSSASLVLLLLLGLIAMMMNIQEAMGQLSTVRAFLSDSDLNELLTKESPLFAKTIEEQTIADMKFTQHVSIIGDVDISVTNIKIAGVSLGNLQVLMQQPNQVTLSDQNAQLTINANWAYRQQSWPHSSGSGTVVVSTNTIQIQETVLITLDINSGKPQFQVTTNTVDLGNLNINISGGSGWILDLLQSLFSSQIKSSVQSAIQNAVSSSVAKANADIQTANLIPTLNMTVGSNNFKVIVDYRLTECDVQSNNFLVIATRATFYDPNKGPSAPLPFGHVQLPKVAPTQIDDLIDAYGTDFVINSLLYALYSSNQMQTYVTPTMIPSNSPIQLNTTSLKLLLPQLYNAYPNKLVNLFVYSNTAGNPGQYPNIKITQNNGGSITAFFYGNVEFQVLNQDGSSTNAFIISLVANATLDSPKLVVSSGSKLYFTAQIANPQFQLSVSQSWIGPISVTSLQQIIQVALIDAYLPILNQDLAAGVQLVDFSSVLPGFNLVNPNLILQNGYVTMGVNGYYSPSLLYYQKTGKKIYTPLPIEELKKKIEKLKGTIKIQK
ncbi:bactericidal permeability-increasing protein/lipopolysaccharide-binding protein [Naegleria gruberi]|uniref:Bactericidal permeability-increasing protein/lipopolysaccharide-binding protein n=1 Tax=Naegleria gruberi TaxID=5762 RepID=D2V2V7_NAEGR|nr:bactericidal permeability-increasing protein/lipopolysaccharide-binding protein [Naegleria gruberi]EFC49128.1 bactericidal permeability-increasing protein/lipopolysaccharide-binding protein [Naegleria gruberi]|eukprot:XP_002681872.1 bactericidal permeability-increasing protein/lipopolysaccharide-binding protein [Naegleria gruberi strain NEG-M]